MAHHAEHYTISLEMIQETEVVFDTSATLDKFVETWETTQECPIVNSVAKLEAIADKFLSEDKVKKILVSSEEDVWIFYNKVTRLIIDSARLYNAIQPNASKGIAGTVIACIEIIDMTLDDIVSNIDDRRYINTTTQPNPT